MGYVMDPDGGMITRQHFYGYGACDGPDTNPPFHVRPVNPQASWYPLRRPRFSDAQPMPGPGLVGGGGGMPCLGVDPTDPTTWGGRGYNQCAGMVGRLNMPNDWRGNTDQLNPLGAP